MRGSFRSLLFAAACLPAFGAPCARPDDRPPPGQGAAVRAREKVAAKDFAGALPLFFRAIREETDYGAKYALRDEILALPPVPARPLSERELHLVATRVAEERLRDVERKTGELERKGLIRAGRLLRIRLAKLEGMAPEQAGRLSKDVERIDETICDRPTDEEKAAAKALEGDPKDVEGAILRAGKAAEEGKGRVALRVYQAVVFSGLSTQEQKNRASDLAKALRARMCEEISEEETKAADELWGDPHWKTLATSVSHEFLFIGAKSFVDSISADDRIRVDLACVFLGDLVGRDMTEDGERLSIYYKERFDFGGGIGGGKRIDIGNKAIAKPIAGTLHYHELSHCVFDLGMIYKGFVEGIANFGAIFALDCLGRGAEADGAIRSNRASYDDDYLKRRIAYWRIQSYAPSCGFLLTPVPGKGEAERRPVWARYRRFFRRLREGTPEEPRDAERIRAFAHAWGETFGYEILEAAGPARFPVAAADKERLRAEATKWRELVDKGEMEANAGYHGTAMETLAPVLKDCHAGELLDRAKFAMALCHEGVEKPADRDLLYAELGVLPRWKLCLPFYSRGIPPLLAVFPPEKAIDLGAEYPNNVQLSIWKDAKTALDGRVDLLEHGVGYPEDATAYALTYVTVPKDVPDATLFLGFDDVACAWVNGALVEKWEVPTGFVRDDRTGPAPLRAGRNRILLKIGNRTGAWGFAARIVHADRSPIEGLTVVAPPAKDFPPTLAPDAKPKVVVGLDFEKAKALPKGRLKPTVGAWQVADKALRRTDPGNVLWQKFLVQPYLNKDPPSGLCWLADKELAALGDFSVELLVRLPREGVPRVGVTLHGEERDDGLSGHTFLVSGGGEGVTVRLDEYDRPVYQATRPVTKAAEHLYRFERRGRTLSCFVNDVPVLDAVDLPPLPRAGIGFMTWDKETGIVRIRVTRLE